jgi:hypothetical protein
MKKTFRASMVQLKHNYLRLPINDLQEIFCRSSILSLFKNTRCMRFTFSTLICCLILQVLACGQGAKAESSARSNVTQSDQKITLDSKENLKSAIVVKYESGKPTIYFYDSEGKLHHSKSQDEFFKHHPYYETLLGLSKWQSIRVPLSGHFDLSQASIDKKMELFSHFINKLTSTEIGEVDYVSFGLRRHANSDVASKVLLFDYWLMIESENKEVFAESKIIGLDSNEKEVFTFDKDVSARYVKLVSDKWIFGRYNKANEDPNAESCGTVGPYFIISVPDGKEYILPQFLGFKNDYSEELPEGSYNMEDVKTIDNQVFMTFLDRGYENNIEINYKCAAIVDTEKKSFKYVRVIENKERSVSDSLLFEKLKTSNSFPFQLKK